jgi:hypothetical protein
VAKQTIEIESARADHLVEFVDSTFAVGMFL